MSAVVPTADLARRVQGGDRNAFAALMRRFNRRLFRTARAILKDDAAAEDALQDAYIAVYQHIDAFRGDADLSTWLTRVVVNQALQALRKTRRQGVVVSLDSYYDEPHAIGPNVENAAADAPERAVMRAEIRRLVERKIDDLPDAFRIVFVPREVEEMTIEEVARCLGIPEATVRTRLFERRRVSWNRSRRRSTSRRRTRSRLRVRVAIASCTLSWHASRTFPSFRMKAHHFSRSRR